ncbi:MAG TPA: SagB/ThcOx family dehydrogenase, partial [Desulfobaccales bacterium]|nr:SagB/ThcOx family dehydrogenase [Desulfobaccales bacterium]
MNQPETGIARRYLEQTRYRRRTMGEKSLAYPRAPLYKEYPDAAARLSLDPESDRRGADLWQCVAQRRSQRDYLDRPLTQVELAALLWATQGITGGMGGYQFRASPSAGALYPVETYLAVHRVEGVAPGIWHFQVLDFALELVAAG